MKADALGILDRLTHERESKEDRLTDLLRPNDAENTPDWFFCVPACFNLALDIKQTPRVLVPKTPPVPVWTQGREFAFKPGDVFYDKPMAQHDWPSILRHVAMCVQITAAQDATSPTPPEERSPGSVTFDILMPDKDHARLVKFTQHVLTQDDFVRFLVAGEETAKKLLLP